MGCGSYFFRVKTATFMMKMEAARSIRTMECMWVGESDCMLCRSVSCLVYAKNRNTISRSFSPSSNSVI